MNPSGFIFPRARLRLFFAGLVLLAVAGRAQPQQVDERMANLREKIATMEGVVSNAKPAEKARLDENLQRLRRELALREERQALDERERQLQAGRARGTLDTLREKLRNIVIVASDVETRIQQIVLRQQQAVTERDTLSGQVSAAPADSAARVALQERLDTKQAELDALGLEREAAEAEVELSHDADQLKKKLKELDTANAQPSLRALFEAYTSLNEGRKAGNKLAVDAANVEKKLKSDQDIFEVNQQKLANAAGDAAQLEKQTGFFTRDPKIEALLLEERGKKDVLGERLPFLSRQVEADKHTKAVIGLRQELAGLEATFRQEQYLALKDGYLQRLRWPGVALTGLLLVHLLASYLLLPIAYKNESLVLARRLVRYIMVVAATVVVAGFLFDDLKVVAAAGGLVSAALVISLKDVCASVFGWFVIMLGGKFGIGDRLEVEGVRGDVIDIELFRTTLLEINGWLGTDQPTGRVLTLPNSFVFTAKVFNFNHEHPYIWGKIDLTITFATAVAPAIAVLFRALEEETREQFATAQKASLAMRRRYGVEDAVYKPRVNTLIGDNGVTLSLFYVSHYREFSATRNKLNRRFIAELEKHPEIQLAFRTLQVLQGKGTGDPAAVLGDDEDPAPSTETRTVAPAQITIRS